MYNTSSFAPHQSSLEILHTAENAVEGSVASWMADIKGP